MHRYRKVLVAIVLVTSITSISAAYPLTNVVGGNEAGWFTVDNIDAYGDDLDSRVDPGDEIFTGHPSYVMGSDNARLLNDVPRAHYYAVSFTGTEIGDAYYRNLTRAFESGTAEYVISGPMTKRILIRNDTAEAAFVANYCRVETDGLYNETHANLYRWVGDTSDCPNEKRPNVANMSSG